MELLNRRAAADFLGISVPTLDRLIKNGTPDRGPLPARKIYAVVRIDRAELESWVASMPTPTTPRRGRPRGSTKAAMAARRAAQAAG